MVPGRDSPIVSGPDRAITALLLAFVVLWTAFSTISRFNLDVHGDMVENFAWGIGWQLGYHKHPPLFGWIVAAWFAVFPRHEIFYFLLSSLNIAVTVLVMQRIASRFLDDDQRVLLVACALVLPPLSFLATNYNATSAMLPFWALTFLFYLRLIEGRRVSDAVLLGVFAALSMLTKYHSLVLLLAIAAHMVLDRAVRPMLATRLPWIAALAGLVVLAPHIWWMVDSQFRTVRYASDQGDGDMGRVLLYALRLVPVVALYSLPAYGLLLLHRYRHDGLAILAADQFRALWQTAGGRALVAAATLTVLFTIALGLALEAEVSSLWSIPFFVFLPILMVLCLPAPLARRGRTVIPLVLSIYAAALLAAAPFVEDFSLARARSNTAAPLQAIAEEVQQRWHASTRAPLAIVASDSQVIANSIAFYADDRPYAIQGRSHALTPWVTPADVERQGAAFVCRNKDAACRERAETILGRIDVADEFEVAATAGAGGRQRFAHTLFLRLP